MGVNGLVKRVLREVGISEERFNLQWASAAEAPRFVRLITEYTRKIKELGPLGASENLKGEELKARLDKAMALLSDRKLRMGFGNLAKSMRKDIAGLNDRVIADLVEEKLGKTISSFGSGEDKAANG